MLSIVLLNVSLEWPISEREVGVVKGRVGAQIVDLFREDGCAVVLNSVHILDVLEEVGGKEDCHNASQDRREELGYLEPD